MTDSRKLIRQLATSEKVAAGTRKTAEKMQARAKQIDPKGDFVVERASLKVNGLPRIVWLVVNKDPDAGRVEFGRQSGREGSDGRGGLRPLGRAARSVKG